MSINDLSVNINAIPVNINAIPVNINALPVRINNTYFCFTRRHFELIVIGEGYLTAAIAEKQKQLL